MPNVYSGVLIGGATTGNTIGGTTALSRNVISGNLQYGVFIAGTNTSGNVVEGNYMERMLAGALRCPMCIAVFSSATLLLVIRLVEQVRVRGIFFRQRTIRRLDIGHNTPAILWRAITLGLI